MPGDDSGPRDAELAQEPGVHAGERLRSRFRDLRSHFVFEYYPWYQTDPYDHWNGVDTGRRSTSLLQ